MLSTKKDLKKNTFLWRLDFYCLFLSSYCMHTQSQEAPFTGTPKLSQRKWLISLRRIQIISLLQACCQDCFSTGRSSCCMIYITAFSLSSFSLQPITRSEE